MAPLTAVALTAAGIALARLTTRGLDWLLTTALERRDALVTRALTDPDDIDREYELLTAHHPDGDQCAECGSPLALHPRTRPRHRNRKRMTAEPNYTALWALHRPIETGMTTPRPTQCCGYDGEYWPCPTALAAGHR